MDSFGDAVARLRAAAEPTRLRLLRLLQNGEFNVKDLTQLLGQSQPRVSRHIKLLAEAGLIERYQEASWVFVRASSDPGVRSFIEAALSLIAAHDPQILRDAERSDKIRAARSLLAQTYFDQNAAEWDRIRSLHVPERDVEAAILEALGLGPYELLLDLGTGTGRVLELAAGRARRLVGVDTNREMLKCARVRLDKAELVNCSVRLADIYNLPFSEESAGAVVIHQVLHFLDNPKAALIEAIRVLQPGGRLVLVDFAPHNLEFLRQEHAHVRLGFAAGEIAGWLGECGLGSSTYRELQADHMNNNALTVAVWAGEKASARTQRWRAAS
ncbi:MAG: metalloregulator ArsR/SmtB family transcription factor [Rhodomicrobium sp.]|jgi:ArsR family transcriptional regulator